MKSERKLMYQQKKISELEAEVKKLTQENSALLRTNTSLHNAIDSMQLSIEEMQSNHDAAMDRLNSDIKNVNELKTKYTEMLLSVETLKKDYNNKMSLLLKRLRKQKV